jgi:hypothetical protein
MATPLTRKPRITITQVGSEFYATYHESDRISHTCPLDQAEYGEEDEMGNVGLLAFFTLDYHTPRRHYRLYLHAEMNTVDNVLLPNAWCEWRYIENDLELLYKTEIDPHIHVANLTNYLVAKPMDI